MNETFANISSLGVLEAAKLYKKEGIHVTPVGAYTKAPYLRGWQKTPLTEAQLHTEFFEEKNIAALNGSISGNLVDIDLDCDEAAATWRHFALDTGMIFGTDARPETHWMYRADRAFEHLAFRDPMIAEDDRNTLIEIRANSKTGGATASVIPPSLHPTGGNYIFSKAGLPANVDANHLVRVGRRAAASALIARYWTKGSRQQAAMALSGGLLRAGWSEDEVATFLKAVMDAGKDDPHDRERRLNAIGDTARKLDQNGAVTGWPTLAGLVGKDVVTKVTDFLELSKPTNEEYVHTEESRVNTVERGRRICVAEPMADVVQRVDLTPDRDVAVIPGFFNQGLSLLLGDPKAGKSLFGLQALLAVATGGTFLDVTARKGKALYLSLEDDEFEVVRRVKIMDPELQSGSDLSLTTKISPWKLDGKAELEQILHGIDLAVIDTAAAFGLVGQGLPNKSAYFSDYQPFQELKELARSTDTAVVVLHHTAKGKHDKPIQSVNGTQGIPAAADSVLLLSLDKRGEYALNIESKQRKDTLDLVFDSQKLTFYLNDPTKTPLGTGDCDLLRAINDMGRVSVASLANYLKISSAAAKKRLARNRLGITKVGKMEWGFATASTSHAPPGNGTVLPFPQSAEVVF